MDASNLYLSQLGEDILIERKWINQKVEDGIFIEMGAVDGLLYSNTFHLEHHNKFNGILIEPVPQFYKRLQQTRPKCIKYQAAISDKVGTTTFIGNSPCAGISDTMTDKHKQVWHRQSHEYEVKTLPMSDILAKHNIKYVDFFSLDVEGGELEVLKTIPFDTVPFYIICIEIDKSNTDRNKECRDILRTHGFVCDGRMELNEFWINPTYFRKDILYVKPEEPLTPFTITAKTRTSNIGYHPYMQHHIIDKIVETINKKTLV